MNETETLKSRFIPKQGDEFFLLNGHGNIIQEWWRGTEDQWHCWAWGNVFRTEEEARENYQGHRWVNLGRFMK